MILPTSQQVLSLLPPFASELAIPDESAATSAVPATRAALGTHLPPIRYAPDDAYAIIIRGPNTDKTGG